MDLNTRYDLGVSSQHTKNDVDAKFQVANVPRTPLCVVCQQVARYKLVSKVEHIPQHTLDKDGYICQHCMQRQYFNPDIFALRDLSGVDRGSLPIW